MATPDTGTQVHTAALAPSFRRGLLMTSSGSVMNLALLFLETIIAARLLTTHYYGVYVLLIAVVNFMVISIDFGCKTAITQMLASNSPTRQAALANTALLFRLIVVVAVGCAIWLGRDLLYLLDPSLALVASFIYVPLMLASSSFDELLASILQGFQAYRHIATAQVLRSVLRIALSFVLLVVFNMGIFGLIWSWVISFSASAAYQYASLPISRRFVIEKPLLGQILRFGFPLQATRFLWFAFRQLNILLVGALAGASSAAFFAVASRIPDAIQRLSESYTSVYFPTVTNLMSKGMHKQAVWMLNHSLRLISFAAGLVALVSVVFSREIVVLLFSRKYEPSSPVFGMLMLTLHMTFLVTLMGYTLTACGRPGYSLATNFTQAGLNVLFDLIFIPVLGFVGPAFATLISIYMTNPFSLSLLRRAGIAVAVWPQVKQTLLLLLCVGIYWWLQPGGTIYRLAILVIFVALNLAASTITRSDLYLVLPSRNVTRSELAEGDLA